MGFNMTDSINLELDIKFLENFFGLADMPAPKNITQQELNDALLKIRNKLSNLALASSGAGGFNSQSPATGSSFGEPSYIDMGSRTRSILIVDDLGIITYQLDVLFKKMGFEVVISQEIYDAIEKYKKQDFGYAIIDLFIPTEREGFILLDELKKLALLCKLNTKIIVMTASSKPEYYTKCLNRGADAYIEKTAGWQKAVIEACLANK